MKNSIYFWGTFLMVLGTCLLIDNLHQFPVDTSNLILWWPVILIIWGLSLLKIPEIIKSILMAIAGAFFAIIIYTLISGTFNFFNFFDNHHDNGGNFSENCTSLEEVRNVDKNIKYAKLNLSTGASRFDLSGTKNYVYHVVSNSSNCKIDQDFPSDSLIVLNFNHGNGKKISKISKQNKMQLYNGYIWDLDISSGASSMDLNLKDMKIASLEIDAGASNTELTLDALLPLTNVNINCGAAEFVIIIPKNAGCSVQGDLALSNFNFVGLEKNSAGVYISKDYYQNDKKIDFNIDGALSNIKIIRR